MQDPITIRKAIYSNIKAGNAETVHKLLIDHPSIREDHSYGGRWLQLAAKTGNLDVIRSILDLGLNVNECYPPENATALIAAVEANHLQAARFLLSRGADPNLGRPVIAAINIEVDDLALEFVKLLVEHGLDVGRSYPWFGDSSKAYSAIEWASLNERNEIVSYLRQIKDASEIHNRPQRREDYTDEVVAYFEETVGSVDPRRLIQVVPSSFPPIDVRMVPATKERGFVTIFTSGMSSEAMNVPAGETRFQFAELFIQLLGDWGHTQLNDSRFSWPVQWLRVCAQYPHVNKTWLGGPAAVIANGDPPRPLGPNTQYTSLLLIAEKAIGGKDKREIQLYRMVPLYTEERDLEINHGIGSLLRAFDRNSIPFTVTANRPNIAKLSM